MAALTFSILLFASLLCVAAGGGSVGVNYGRIANNLPSASKVVRLLKSQGIDRVKVYDSDPAVIKALAGSGIKLTVNLPNELLNAAARRPSFAYSWVKKNVASYHPATAIEAIAVGNEVFVDTHNTTRFLIPAMYNIHQALQKYKLDDVIKVSSPIALSALQNSYPSSAGSFRPDLVGSVFKPMLEFLRKTGSSLMINVYPFFAYESNADVIPLEYALFRQNPGVVDAGNGLRYYSLFDAQIDAVFAAMSALKYDDVPITVSETGWPSKGDSSELGASVANAASYNGNLVRRVLAGGGTPLRPNANLTVFLFALFNENKKVGPTSERNFGLFYPDEKKVYDIPLTAESLKGYQDAAPPLTGGEQRIATGSGQSWCVAKAEAGKEKLQQGLDFACGEGGADCHPIQPGSTCFDPNTVEAHASYAFARSGSHQLSNGLMVSGRPEQQLKDRQPTMGSRAVPYTGGDIKKSGELGRMYGVDLSSGPAGPPKAPSRQPSSSRHNSGSARSGPNSGPMSKKSSSSSFSGPMTPIQPTGLITSGPLGSSSSNRRSGQLDTPSVAAPIPFNKAVYGTAVTSLSDGVKLGFMVSRVAMWMFLIVVVMGVVVGVFLMVAVKKPVILVAAAAVLIPVVGIFVWNYAYRIRGVLGFLKKYPDAELRGAVDGQFVKVTGVVTCGSIPLETSFQRVQRCVYASSELYEYRGFGGKPAHAKQRWFSWGCRYSEKYVADFYISDFQSGLRALVKAGYGAKVAPFVKPTVVVDVTKNSKKLSPNFLQWLSAQSLSSEDDRVMKLKEGYIKEGSTVSVMGVVRRHENVVMIVPPSEAMSTGCRWPCCLLPTYVEGLILTCDEAQNADVVIPV